MRGYAVISPNISVARIDDGNLLRLYRNGTNDAYISASADTGTVERRVKFGVDAGGGYIDATANAGPVNLRVAGTTYMRISTAGDLGVNTTEPQSKFHVNSTTANVYIHSPVNNTAIASTDCDADAEVGRSILAFNVTSSYLYVYSIQSGSTTGWRVLQTLGA